MMVQNKRHALRSLLNASTCFFPASIFDPLSGRAAEEIGYECLFMAGSVASLVILGAPDLVIITLSELAEQTRRIARATSLPFFLDADHGFGNALSVMRTVQELEAAGLSGLTIEDTELPDPFGRAAGQPLPIEEGAAKMRAALAARQDPAFVIIGRTGAVGSSGLEDALKRIAVYQDTGVDAIFLSGLKSRAEVEACAKACRLPLLLGAVPPSLFTQAEFSALGVRAVITGHRPHAAGIKATSDMLRLAQNGTPPKAPEEESALMDRLTRKDDYATWRKHFLTRGQS
jgi:carboxyvinyl-carboxyphosphonate phosphorylmutase